MAWAPYEPIIIQPAVGAGSILYATYWRLTDFWVWDPNNATWIDPQLQNESDWPPLSTGGVDGLVYVPWYNGGSPATLTGIYYLDTATAQLTAAGTYLVLIKSYTLPAVAASNDPIQAYGLLTIRTGDHYAFQRLVEGDPMAVTNNAIGTAQAPLLANLDVAVSTRLASVSYTAPPSAADIATAWGSSVVGNGRTRDMYLQGYTNKIEQSTDGLLITVYSWDDTTVLQEIDATRFPTTVGGIKNVTP